MQKSKYHPSSQEEPPLTEDVFYQETPEQEEKYREYVELLEQEKKEFKDREKEVQDGYIANFLPYLFWDISIWDNCNWFSFWDIDTDILIKACQNDIRMLLKKFWEWFNGKATITFKNWRPEFMNINIESNENNSSTKDFNTLKDYIYEYWFVTHKKYGEKTKKLYGEKYFRYADKNRAVDDPEEKWPFSNSIPKKLLKKWEK